MADQKLSALSAIPTSDINNNTLLYVVDTVGTDTSYQVTRSALYLAIPNTWTAQQTLTVINSTALVINIATGPTGGSTKFIGALSVVANTVAFATTPQTGDYATNEIGQATLTNPAAGTIQNASSLVIDGPPVASTNVTVTNTRSLWVKSGSSEFDGKVTLTSTVIINSVISSQLGTTESVGFGVNALFSNTTGTQNSAFGVGALQNNTTANYNSAFGVNALFSNTTGTQNSAFGVGALQNVVTGNNNVSIGFNAGHNYTSSESNNIVIGANILGTSGESNILRIANIIIGNLSTNALQFAGLFSQYNGITTAGIGVPAIYGTVGLGVNLNTTSTTIASYTPSTTGFFSVRIAISCKTSSTVALTISYTDPESGTITNQSIYSKALTGGTTDSLTFNIYASTTTAITVSGTDSVALGDSYVSAQVERLQ